MELTVGELKELLNVYPDDSPVIFQHIIMLDGRHYRLNFCRIDDRGTENQSICHFEWNPITEEDEIKF